MNKEYKYLYQYKKRLVDSQHGEDGMIDTILSTIPDLSKESVELGALDGITGSNTNFLIKRGYKSILIECDDIKYKKLVDNMKNYENAICIKRRISLELEENLNEILKEQSVSEEFDVFSLDIDGNDYHIWKDFKFNPKIVIIECTLPLKDQDYIMPYHKDGILGLPEGTEVGTGTKAYYKLGLEKGYDLIGMTRPNMIFIKHKYNTCWKKIDVDTWYYYNYNILGHHE